MLLTQQCWRNKATGVRGVTRRHENMFVLSNDAYEEIIATARKRKCERNCMASPGRRRVSALVIGSEAHKVLTHSKSSLLLIR